MSSLKCLTLNLYSKSIGLSKPINQVKKAIEIIELELVKTGMSIMKYFLRLDKINYRDHWIRISENRYEYNEIFSQATSLANSIGKFISMNKNQEDLNKKKFRFKKAFKPAVETILQDLKSRIDISEVFDLKSFARHIKNHRCGY